jgi:hypothetical protein
MIVFFMKHQQSSREEVWLRIGPTNGSVRGSEPYVVRSEFPNYRGGCTKLAQPHVQSPHFLQEY